MAFPQGSQFSRSYKQPPRREFDLSLRAGILTLGPNPLPWIIGPTTWALDNNNSPLGMVGLGMEGLHAIAVGI